MHLRATYAVSPSMRTTLAKFWDGIAALWAMLSFVLAPISCSPRSSGDCTPSRFTAAAPPRIRSIYLWGSCFENSLDPSPMVALRRAGDSSVHTGPANLEGPRAIDQERSSLVERFARGRLAHSGRRRR